MKLSIHTLGDHDTSGRGLKVVESDLSGQVVLSKVFNPVTILTEDGHRFHVCQRGSGIEVTSPDGTLVGIMTYEGTEVLFGGVLAKKGQAFLERDGRVVG